MQKGLNFVTTIRNTFAHRYKVLVEIQNRLGNLSLEFLSWQGSCEQINWLKFPDT